MLGILAINIAGFAGPPAATYAPAGAGWADAAAYTLALVLFEGKMRTLFALLFGASMELFVQRAQAAGEDGEARQLRRLLWLAVFGYLHFLLWWGDILFTYAAVGVAALALRGLRPGSALAAALLIFAGWQLSGVAGQLPLAIAEARVAAASATAAQASDVRQAHEAWGQQAREGLAATRRGLVAQANERLATQPLQPLWAAYVEVGEILPIMLLGGVLLRAGFFAGTWSPAAMRLMIGAGLGLGGGATLAFAGWAWRAGFPPAAMRLAIDHALGLPHLLMALGIAGVLVRHVRAILATRLGKRIAAAGRMAFSNYLATSLVMTALFYGWGLGLAGRVGSAGQVGFVLLGWALMLGWSAPWLARHRQGPLEWLWRSLVARQVLRLRK